MTPRLRVGERQAWIAAVAVLATSLAWLASLVVLWGVRGWLERRNEVVVLARVAAKLVSAIAPVVQAALPAAAVAMVLSGVVAVVLSLGAKREVRHG